MLGVHHALLPIRSLRWLLKGERGRWPRVMRMKRHTVEIIGVVAFLIASVCVVHSQSVDELLARASRSLRDDLTVEIPNTRSPDGRYALFAISTEGTAGVTGIASTGRQRCLAVTSVFQYGLNYDDRRPQSYLTVLWSADSSRVAIHDSARKHSRLEVYRINATTARRIDVSGSLTQAMAAETLVSSGQEPLEWVGNARLVVECRGKLQTGELYRKRVTVDIANETANRVAGD
jgi:hypothetical protein